MSIKVRELVKILNTKRESGSSTRKQYTSRISIYLGGGQCFSRIDHDLSGNLTDECEFLRNAKKATKCCLACCSVLKYSLKLILNKINKLLITLLFSTHMLLCSCNYTNSLFSTYQRKFHYISFYSVFFLN